MATTASIQIHTRNTMLDIKSSHELNSSGNGLHCLTYRAKQQKRNSSVNLGKIKINQKQMSSHYQCFRHGHVKDDFRIQNRHPTHGKPIPT